MTISRTIVLVSLNKKYLIVSAGKETGFIMSLWITSTVAALTALVICGFIYLRMIKREVPETIGKLRAFLPVVLGGICMPVSGACGLGILAAFKRIGIGMETLPSLPAAFFTAFFMAGFVEELFKFLVIIIMMVVLKDKINNVYEYILLGAAVGFGFTVVEDFSYGNSIAALLTRMPLMFTHMTLNMIMGEFLGRAQYNKRHGNGPTALYWVLALVIPTALHTLYDAGTVANYPAFIDNDFAVGGTLGGIAILTNLVLMIHVLVRARKKAAGLSALT